MSSMTSKCSLRDRLVIENEAVLENPVTTAPVRLLSCAVVGKLAVVEKLVVAVIAAAAVVVVEARG
jgi:hypothetical protein